MTQEALTKFYNISKENDLVLFHVNAMSDYYAVGLRSRFIRTNVVPALQPTREFVNPIISFLNPPSFLNKLSYKLTDLGLKIMSKPISVGDQHFW